MNFSYLSIAVFGDSHVDKHILPPNIVIIGRAGEKLANYKSYESELVGYDVLVIMMGGIDISSNDPLVIAPSELKGLWKPWVKWPALWKLTMDFVLLLTLFRECQLNKEYIMLIRDSPKVQTAQNSAGR